MNIAVPPAAERWRWAALANRSKDRDDVRNMLAVRGADLDWAYVARWSTAHDTLDLLGAIPAKPRYFTGSTGVLGCRPMFKPVSARRRSPLRVWLVFSAAISLSSACGVSISPSTNQEFTGSLAEFTVGHHDFQAGKAGATTIRLTWTNGGVDLDLDVRGTSCSDEQFLQHLQEGSHQGNSCNSSISYSGSGGEKFEELTLDAVTKDQQVRIFIVNNGPGSQDYKVSVNIG